MTVILEKNKQSTPDCKYPVFFEMNGRHSEHLKLKKEHQAAKEEEMRQKWEEARTKKEEESRRFSKQHKLSPFWQLFLFNMFSILFEHMIKV